MNAQPSLLATLPPPTEAGGGTLDERIAAAELRLMEREQRLRGGVDSMLQRLRSATEPRRLLWPAMVGVLSLVAVAWVWRRLGRGRRAGNLNSAEPARGRAGSPPRSDVLWVRAAALAWPLLPAHWRARVGPGTASLVVAVGLPLAEQLFKRAAPAPLPTVLEVDAARFAGTWYEVAHLPALFEASCTNLRSVSFIPDGTAFEVVRRCGGEGSQDLAAERVTHHTARVIPGSGGARFELSALPNWLRGLPFAWAERCVVHLEPDYSVAMLGSPRRDHLSILSRRHELPPQALRLLVDRARELGFAVDRLHHASAA